MDGVAVTLSFWILAAVTLVAAAGVVLARNLLHAVLLLILSFVGIAGFFLLLSAEFLAMAQVIIYVGAVAVLVLFAILLTPHAGRDNGETRMAVPALLLSLCLLAVLCFVIQDTAWPLATGSGPGLSAADLGEALLTTWVLPFEVASVLLTAALVGAIMLARTPQDEAEDALA